MRVKVSQSCPVTSLSEAGAGSRGSSRSILINGQLRGVAMCVAVVLWLRWMDLLLQAGKVSEQVTGAAAALQMEQTPAVPRLRLHCACRQAIGPWRLVGVKRRWISLSAKQKQNTHYSVSCTLYLLMEAFGYVPTPSTYYHH